MNGECLPDEEVSNILDYFQTISACEHLDSSPLPSPDLIWWRSQLIRRRQLARRATIAIDAIRIIAFAVLAAFIVCSFVLWAPEVFRSLPVPLPVTMAAILLFGCSTGGVLMTWSRHR